MKVTASEITNWANTQQKHCQGLLPELVRRLILAHAVNSIDEFNFPSGDSVAIGGWDGRLNTPIVSPFFPVGYSGWEIGTEKSAKSKADKDYLKRTADSLGISMKESTFVFVTPRSFPKSKEWEDEKKALGDWKDIKVIAADILEQWLDITPAVAIWLARQIGKVALNGIRDLEYAWEEWTVGTNPILTPELVIAGRAADQEVVQKWVLGQPSILAVKGDHPSESLAFLYSSVATLPENEKIQTLARCMVVDNIGEFRQLIQAFQNYPLIIAVPGECMEAANLAVSKGHHVYISANEAEIGIRNPIRLSRPRRETVEKSLHNGGLSEADAQKIARDAGLSIPVLRRSLFQSNIVRAPEWAQPETAKILLPALFANAWNDNKEGDKQIIEILAGKEYQLFIKDLTPLLSIDDAPVQKVGDVWMIKSPLDVWYLQANYLERDQLDSFRNALISVITKTDPKYELTSEKRWTASMYGKANAYSEWLRTGLVESLTLFAVFGNQSPKLNNTQSFADNVVKEILITANTWEAWASMKNTSALLAEAAPDVFMQAVEEKIKTNPEIFEELMKDDRGTFGECRHCGLLWALEGIAWSPEYFARAANLLAMLANIDPGGGWSNRAVNSLGDIFLPGLPQTHAKPEERLVILKKLSDQHPQLVWKFAENYYGGGGITESHRFRWRHTGGQRRGLEQETNEEYNQYLNGLLPLLQDLACVKENLVSSLNQFIRLPEDIRKKVVASVESTDPKLFSKEDRLLLLQEVREALNWINSYGEDDRLANVPGLNNILEKFSPRDAIDKHGWLLSNPWPRLPEGEPKEYDAKSNSVRDAQSKAAREVLDSSSIQEIIEFAKTIQYPAVLGSSLAVAIKNEKEDNDILQALLENGSDISLLIRGYSMGRVEAVGAEWVDKKIQHLKSKKIYSPSSYALLASGLPENAETWAKVKAAGKKEEEEYWKAASGYSQKDKSGEAAIAVEELLNVNRPEAALKIAGDPHADISSNLLQRLIETLLNKKEALSAGVMEEFHLGHVFNQLYEKNELPVETIASLEWPFAQLFDELKRYTSKPLAIHRTLQSDPSFFAQLIGFIYRRDDQSPDPAQKGMSKKELERKAQNAHRVLDSWYLLPGLKEDGSIDEAKLISWILEARRLCSKTKHLIGCDIQIGYILAHAPTDIDGTWPNIAVRNIIEKLNNESIDRHIQIEIYNSRGVVSRGINDGGEQERVLVDKYSKMSAAVRADWPRTSTLLKSIAQSYESEAKSNDIESELNDFRWN